MYYRTGNKKYPYTLNSHYRRNYQYEPKKSKCPSIYPALQIHPNFWDENGFSEFKKIVNFLIQNDVTFITPYEYYQLIN